MQSGLNGDSAWFLYVAGRVLDGERLYVDVVEANPPLVIWLNLPIVLIARASGWSEVWVYRLGLWAATLLSLWLADRMLRRLEPALSQGRRCGLLLALLVVLVGMPGGYFGQREHLALVLALPWMLLSAARVGGAPTGRSEAIAVGALAAVGVALKPHFLLLPLAVAGYVYASAPASSRRVHTETRVLAGGVFLCFLLVPLLAPEYLSFLSRLGALYWDYLRRPLGAILAGDLRPLFVVGALVYWPLARRLSGHPRLVDVLGLATAALFAAVVLQHKGLGYHYYPAIGTGALLIVMGLLGGARDPLRLPVALSAHAVGLFVLLPVVALFLGWAVARAGGGARKGVVAAGAREIRGYLGARRPVGAVAIWSPWMEDSFPLMLGHQAAWASRYPFVWFLPALYRDEIMASEPVMCRRQTEMSRIEQDLVTTMAEDLHKHRPGLVFVRKPASRDLLRVPILACFSQVEAFRREFASYRPLVDLEHFQVFRRTAT